MLAEIYYVLNDKNLAIQNLEFALTKSIGKESEIVSIKERLQEMSELKING